MINRARTLASFSPSDTKSPLACLFFKPNNHGVKLCSKDLGQLSVHYYLFGWQLSPTRPSSSKHL